jgi:hypothetical protein
VLWVEPRRAIDQRGERMGERMGECVAHLCGLRRPFGSIGTVYTNVNEVEEQGPDPARNEWASASLTTVVYRVFALSGWRGIAAITVQG